MKVFVCGSVDPRIKPKYLEGIDKIATNLLEHNDGVVTLGHSGVVFFELCGSRGEFTVVDGVEMSVIGSVVIGLLEAVKCDELAGLVEAFGIVDVSYLIGITLEVV